MHIEENSGSILRQEQIILRYTHQRKDAYRRNPGSILRREQQLLRYTDQRKDAYREKSRTHPSAGAAPPQVHSSEKGVI
jgi:hypothetical protein